MPDKQDVSTQSLIQNNGIGVQNNTNQYHENHLQSCSHHISSMRRVHNTSGSSYPTTCPKLPHSPHAIIQTPLTFKRLSCIFRPSTRNMVTRKPSHAGSWYTANGQQLSQQLDGWLEAVPSSTTPIGSASSQQGEVSIPTPNARAIIAP
jgi:hypothetical protein